MQRPDPLAVLLEQLVDHRRHGANFAEAWPLAVATALTGVARLEHHEWRVALNGTREAWEASWHRWPGTRRMRAPAAVAWDDEREPIGPNGTCAYCGNDIPPYSGRGARKTKYCSREHQRAAIGRKLPVAA